MVILFFIPLLLTAQSIEEENIWVPFHYFVGMWEGNETGKAGVGKGERKYDTHSYCGDGHTGWPVCAGSSAES